MRPSKRKFFSTKKKVFYGGKWCKGGFFAEIARVLFRQSHSLRYVLLSHWESGYLREKGKRSLSFNEREMISKGLCVG